MKTSFKRIPNHKSYVISKQGKVYDTKNKIFITPFILHREMYIKLDDELEMLLEIVARTYINKDLHFKDLICINNDTNDCSLSNIKLN
jgi:hypothetical protein